ncbi:MAG: translocation/assembly module TamB domain-containing protein [Vicinamibacterales bacterium]
MHEKEVAQSPKPPGMLRRGWRRATRPLALIAAILAAFLIATFTIDLGPALRGRAERAATSYLKRDVRIGRLYARLIPGRFGVEDLVISGLEPGHRPFLTAKRIDVELPWWSAFSGEILIRSVTMTDWKMVIETFPGNRHNFPRFVPERREPRGPRRWVTTLQYVQTSRGELLFDDHVTPWSTHAPNLSVAVFRVPDGYRGRAEFSKGTVRIQAYEPMWAEMRSTFKIDGGIVKFDRIDLRTDGARSNLTGQVDLGRWPEQTYRVRSRIDFPRMRELFFARDRFTLFGDGDFTGTFRMFRGGRELKGTFSSPLAGVNEYRFPDLKGNVVWVPDRVDVPHATARVFGGASAFTYRMWKPAGATRWRARWDASYENVDLTQFTDFLDTKGLRIAGRATGRNLLEWPLGRFAEGTGEGEVRVDAPPGTHLQGRGLTRAALADQETAGPSSGPFNPQRPLGYVPAGGAIRYRVGPEWIDLDQSWAATSRTYVEFSGRTAYGERSQIPFHVTSSDWQESDRLMVGILTAFASSASAVPVGGYGEFDGVMTKSFTKPLIEGVFDGDGLRAWNVRWGRGRANVAIENGYANVTEGLITDGPSEIRVSSGRFSLGYPRRDGGEEIDARVSIARRPLADLRAAFELHDYPVEGFVSGEFHLFGKYETPNGFGRMTIDHGVAYGETFETARAGLRFEGAGVRLDGIDVRKGSGTMTGAAYVGWNGTYSFDADGRRLPVERMEVLAFPVAPLSGMLQFTATGSGTFEVPRYDVRARIDDLFAGDEGIGQVTTRLGVRGELLTIELEAASPRLSVSGSGRIALTPESDAELSFRFVDSSLDPYVRFLVPQMSPFTTAVVSGSVRVAGQLSDVDHLLVDTTVDDLQLKLFDYRVRNERPIRLALDRHVARIGQLRLAGDGTQLDLSGEIGLHDRQVALRATGDASLGLLQGFFRDIRSAGTAEIVAEVKGSLDEPVFSGRAAIANGRVRHFSLPHGLDGINGRLSFDAAGVRVDDLVARLGGGDVRFAGRVGVKGFQPGDLNLTATGDRMRLRYPEGFISVVDADLALRGPFAGPTLAGTVTVRSATWTRRFETTAGLFNLGGDNVPSPPADPSALPVRFDVRIVAPSTLRVENNIARIVSSADLTLSGTYDRPLLFGHANIERGELFFEGNRYLVTRGSIDFANPTKIEPFFDIEAETRVRVPGQTYRVTVSVSGTADKMAPNLTSDPPLPEVDVLSLLLGEAPDPLRAEIESLRSPQESEEQILQMLGARLIANPVAAPVGRAVEQTFGVDTVQITPLIGDLNLQSVNAAARLTIGKRISNRIFVTYSRALGQSRSDQIILLEYDHSDRVSYVVSRNEDGTYAIDFRVRHTF